MDPFTHTVIATGLCAVFFYSGYAYAWLRLKRIVTREIEAMAEEGLIVIEDDNEDTPREDRLG
jgi:hypothetical protein